MEYRDDLRVLLLNGLPDVERHETLATINRTTTSKLAKLRQTSVDDDPAGVDEDSDELKTA
jgi:hypothetical protein